MSIIFIEDQHIYIFSIDEKSLKILYVYRIHSHFVCPFIIANCLLFAKILQNTHLWYEESGGKLVDQDN